LVMTSVSVVIPCKDDAEPLARCLESLGEQTLRALEVIVVDNASSVGRVGRLRAFSVPKVLNYRCWDG
jgi:glycosyltransferase involved in cell wall biosynthesis